MRTGEKAKRGRNKTQERLISKPKSDCLRGETDNYGRLYKSVLYDPRFTKMTKTAILLYPAMIAESKGGIGWFTFPKSRYERICNKSQFGKARDELVKNGFVDMKKYNNRIATAYRLSDRWKHEVVPEAPDYYPE